MAEELNFGRAARRLYISQPGLSQSIKALEKEIGLSLFERTRQHVALTAQGEMLLPEAHRLLAHAQEVEQLAKQLANSQRSTLLLSHTRSAGVGLPSRLTASFRRSHPYITLQTFSGVTGVNVDRIRARELDVAFVRPPIDMDDDLACTVLAHEPVMLVVPAEHPLADVAGVESRDIVNEPLVYFPGTSGGGLWQSMLDAVYGPGRRPDIRRIEPDEQHMLAAVADSEGIALITESSAAVLTVPGVVIKPLLDDVTVPLALAWRPDNTNPALRSFLSFVRDHEQGGDLRRRKGILGSAVTAGSGRPVQRSA